MFLVGFEHGSFGAHTRHYATSSNLGCAVGWVGPPLFQPDTNKLIFLDLLIKIIYLFHILSRVKGLLAQVFKDPIATLYKQISKMPRHQRRRLCDEIKVTL